VAQNYWNQLLTERLSRRRALTLSAAAAGSAAILAACGSSGSKVDNEKAKSRIVTPVDTTKTAKRGGIAQVSVLTDEVDLSPFTTRRGAGKGGPEALAYSRLLQEKEAVGGTKIAEYVGDLAESWEVGDGGTKLTLKLRADAKFDPRPPTNGRAVDADDVVYSWKTWAAQSAFRDALVNSVNPAAGIISIDKVDARTVTVKTAFPWRPLFPGLAGAGYLIVPVEADGKFEPKSDARGSGPWMLQEYKRGANFSWRRNPNWYQKDFPFLEGFDAAIIPETATAVSQFRAKHLDFYQPANPEDVLSLASELQGVNLYLSGLAEGSSLEVIFFGNRPGSPFADIRLRRAVSMALDRDLYAQVISGGDSLEKAGLAPKVNINSHVMGAWTGLWVDPKGKDLGEGAQYFQQNLAEVKKLLAAAGYPNGIDVKAPVSSASHGAGKPSAITSEMLNAAGIRNKLEVVDYQGFFLPKILQNKGDFEGLSWSGTGSPGFDLSVELGRVWTSFAAASRSSWKDDGQAKIDALVDKAQKEPDTAKFTAIMLDFQKEAALFMGGVPYNFSSGKHNMVWPWLQNWSVYRTSQGDSGLTTNVPGLWHVWYDESKKT